MIHSHIYILLRPLWQLASADASELNNEMLPKTGNEFPPSFV